MMFRQLRDRDRLERARAHVQRHVADCDADFSDLVEQLLGEVQTGGRRGDGLLLRADAVRLGLGALPGAAGSCPDAARVGLGDGHAEVF